MMFAGSRCSRALPAVALVPAASCWRHPAAVAVPRPSRPTRPALPALPRALPNNSADDVTPPPPPQPLAADNPALLVVEQQNERALAYGAITFLLGSAGLALAIAPGRAIEFLWAACPMQLVAGLGRTFGSMLLLAAVCANCLKEAAEHERLTSETYQRLNLALMWWGVGTAAALWLAPQQPLRLALGVCTALLVATSAHAALTYQETSEKGLSLPHLARQFLSSLGNLGNYKNSASSFLYAMYAYGMAAKTTIAATLAILLHGQLRLAEEGLLQAPVDLLGRSLLPVNGVGYALLAVVLYTLKDAAARGRLGASTFKALNIGAAIVALTNALTMASWVQAGIMAATRLAYFKIAANGGLAVLSLYNYAFAKKKK